MCGRFVPPDQAAIEAHYQLHFDFGDWLRRWNTAPTTYVPMIRAAEGGMVAELARWGLEPVWWNKEELPSLTFNARSEEAASKPMWRAALKSTRGLMPAAGWYEWSPHEKVPRASGRKVNAPYSFHRLGQDVVSFAALWSTWQAPDGSALVSCALLTKAAGKSVEAIHDRMPVVLKPARYAAWLSPKATPTDVAAMVAGSVDDFEAYRVGTEVGNVRNESPDLANPLP